jgi:arsenite-transporting ATPase
VSNRARLLVLSGLPGAGTTTVARGWALALANAGLSTRLITDSPSTRTHARESLWPALRTGLAEALAGGGVASVEGEELGSLPGLDDIAMAVHVVDAVDEHADDVVLWDSGGIDRLLGVLHSIGAARLVARRLITPLAAIRGRVDAQPDQPTAMEALADRFRSVEARLHAQAVVQLVTTPTASLASSVGSARSAVALAGCLVDRVIVNQVPQPEDGWPEPWAAERRAWADAVGYPTLQVPLMNQPAAEVIDAMSRVLPVAIPLRSSPQVECVQTASSGLGVESTSPDVELRIHLPGIDARDLRVGRRDDLLLLTAMGRSRTIPLPAIAVRCSMSSARMEGADLQVRFTPDPRLWPGGGS